MDEQKIPKIAILDSGIGGVSLIRGLINKFGGGNYIYLADNEFCPYGNKDAKVIKDRLLFLFNLLFEKFKVDIIFVGCNTASSLFLNEKIDNVIFLEFDKKTNYFTTELTKKNLKNFSVVSSKTLVKNLEISFSNSKKVKKHIKNEIKRKNLNKFSELTLGCTHFEMFEKYFKELCPKTKILKNTDIILKKSNLNFRARELNLFVFLTRNNEIYRRKILNLIKG